MEKTKHLPQLMLEYNCMSSCRRMKIDSSLLPCTELKSKWIKDLNIKLTTLNLIEEKGGSSLHCMGTGVNFLNIIWVAHTIKATINKWDLLKLRSFCKVKDTVNKTKRQPNKWENVFTNPISKDWSPKYIKNSRN